MTRKGSESATLTHSAANATWWSALEIAARYGVQFVVMILLARLLAPQDFGLIAMLLVFTTVAVLLADAGFGAALVQKQKTSDDDESTVFISGIGVSILVGGILWLVSPGIAAFYSQPQLVPLMHTLVLVLPLSALAAVPDALLAQRLDFRSRAVAEIFASLCSGLVAIVMALRGFGAWSLVWQAIVGIGVRALLLWLYSRWRPRGRFRVASFRQLFAFGGYMLMANLMSMLTIRLQSLLIGRLFDSRALGLYTLAQNTQQAPAQFMGGVLNRVGLPVFSTVASDSAKLVGALRFSLRLAIFLFVPCMVGIAVVAKPLIITLYGSRWAPAAPILSILAISTMFWPLHVLNLAAIGAQGRSDLILRLEIVKHVLSIGLIVACSPAGPIAIAGAVLASSVFAVAINTWYASRLLGYGLIAQLHDQMGTLILSLLSGLTAWLILYLLPAGVLAMVAAIAAAVAVYIGGAVLGQHKAIPALIELARMLGTTDASHISSVRGEIDGKA